MSVLCVSGVTVSRISKNCRMLSLPNRVGCILYGSLVTTLKPQIQFARWNRSNKLCKSSGVIEEQGEKWRAKKRKNWLPFFATHFSPCLRTSIWKAPSNGGSPKVCQPTGEAWFFLPHCHRRAELWRWCIVIRETLARAAWCVLTSRLA